MRDVLGYAGYRTLEAGDAEDGHRAGATHRPRPDPDGRPAAGHGRRSRRSAGCATDPATARDPRGRAHGFRDEERPDAAAAGRVRRIPGEADRRARLPGAGRGSCSSARTEWRRDRRRHDAGRRRSPAERQAARCGPLRRAATRWSPRRRAHEALERIAAAPPDLVLLDIVMPDMDGYEVCRRLRADAGDELPAGRDDHGQRRARRRCGAIEAGADDFVAKPFDQAELLARVRSLLRIKRYHDTIDAQAAELAEWNRTARGSASSEQVEQLERIGRLKRFLSPQLVEMVADVGRRVVPGEPPPRDHRGVLRPARVHAVRRDGRARGGDGRARRVPRGAGRAHPPLRGDDRALRRRRADGLLQRPAALRGRAGARRPDGRRDARAGVRAGGDVGRDGHDLGFGVGIAQGYATLGAIGFEGRYDYAAIGTVTNLAARLCAEAAAGRSSSASASSTRRRGSSSPSRWGSSRFAGLRGRRGCSMWSGWRRREPAGA